MALAVFAQVARDELDEPNQRLLVTLRSELRALTGEAELALEDLRAVPWPTQDPLTPRALELQGDMQFRQSQPDAALAQYQAALESVLAQRQNAAIRLHTRRGYTFIQLRDLDFAWGEALLARAEAELYQGEVQEERGGTPRPKRITCMRWNAPHKLTMPSYKRWHITNWGHWRCAWNAWKMRRRICTSACITMRRLATACN